MNHSTLEKLFSITLVRWVAGLVFLCRGASFLLIGRLYRGMNDLCWVARVSDVQPLQLIVNIFIRRMIEKILRCGQNNLRESYLADSASIACASLYSLTGLGQHDIFRDLIVLKSHSPGEKGVILLKYARTFDAVIALFDLPKLLDRYLFVLEPCWAGYCDPSILMFISPGHPVFIQCFTEEDYRFIDTIGMPLVPIRMGPADWVNADLFTSIETNDKTYDLIMVANWAPHKRHSTLFRALEKIHGRKIKVLLIGFPLARWTIDDVRREAALVENEAVEIDILEQVPQQELARYVSQCKVFVFLSKKEGDNKALVEAMFVGVPAIVHDKTIGGARARINPSTGILASDEELSDKIIYMLNRYTDFNPRAWAIQHTGSCMTTRLLNEVIKSTISKTGGQFSESIHEKTNSPNLTYKDPKSRDHFKTDYQNILSCQRSLSMPQSKPWLSMMLKAGRRIR